MLKNKKAKNPVIIASMKHEAGLVDVSKKRGNNVISRQAMNGCDRLDQAVLYYNNLDRKTNKRWKRLFN